MARTDRPRASVAGTLRVGDRVSFTLVGRRVSGVIVEDRGPLGKGGIRLFSVKARLSQETETVFELPADALRASAKAA